MRRYEPADPRIARDYEKTCKCGKKFTTLRKGRKLCDSCLRGKLVEQGYIKETNHDPQS